MNDQAGLSARQLPYFQADTFDDLLHDSLTAILERGTLISDSSSGKNTELWGVTLHLTNPLARLSRSESRGKVFSPLGEFCWYMSGSDRADHIKYYVRQYPGETTDGSIFGAYGPRLAPQVDDVLRQLNLEAGKPSSKRAVIALFDRYDNNQLSSVEPATPGNKIQPPCTCTLQFLIRDGALHVITNMRSNDAVWGLTHDVFCFTMLQEYVARHLGVSLGTYTHHAGSLHVYEDMRGEAEKFLCEGVQPTAPKMPPMPATAPSDGLQELLLAEAIIRRGDALSAYPASPYWADLVRLLEVFAVSQQPATEGSSDRIRQLADVMHHSEYRTFTTQRLDARSL